MVYEPLEGDWKFGNGPNLSFSSVRSSLSLQENLRPLIYAGVLGIFPLFFFGSLLASGTLFSTSSPMSMVLITLVCLGLAFHRLVPKTQGLKVEDRGGKLEITRFSKGKIVQETRGLKPEGFRLAEGRKSIWHKTSVNVASSNRSGKQWVPMEQPVYLITTEGDPVEVAWTKDLQLARQTLEKLKETYKVPVSDMV